MPCEIKWLLPQRVIYVRYYGDLTQADITALSQDIEAYLAEGVAPLYYVADVQIARVSANPVKNRRDFAYIANPKINYVLSCGRLNPIMSFFASVITQAVRFQYRHFETLEEGLAFLRQHDSTLDLSSSEQGYAASH